MHCEKCLATEAEARALAERYELPFYVVKLNAARHYQKMLGGDVFDSSPSIIKLWHALVVADSKICTALAETV